MNFNTRLNKLEGALIQPDPKPIMVRIQKTVILDREGHTTPLPERVIMVDWRPECPR